MSIVFAVGPPQSTTLGANLMPRSIIVFTPEILDARVIAALFDGHKQFAVRGRSKGEVFIHTRFDAADDSFFVSDKFQQHAQIVALPTPELFEDYEEHQIVLLAGVKNGSAFSVGWGDNQFLREVLTILADDPRVVVDSNHGQILPIREFLKWWEENPNSPIG